MKKFKVLLALATFATTASFSTVSFAEESGEQVQGNVNLPDWYLSADKIDPDNPNLENLPDSEVDIVVSDGKTRQVKPIIAGKAQTYINKDGLEWYGTSATTVDEVAASFQVVGTLYKQAKGSTKLTQLDIETDEKFFKKGVVIEETRGKTGTVGSTMISEGVLYVNLGMVNKTVVTTEKATVK